MSKEAYVIVTLRVNVPVSYKGDKPTSEECMIGIREYERDMGVDIVDSLEVVGIEIDPDCDIVE